MIPRTSDARIACLALLALTAHVLARIVLPDTRAATVPLFVVIGIGGVPLVFSLARSLLARQLSTDFLAGIAIVASVLLAEYVVAAVIILMLSGGRALERHATERASSVLDALARRNPSVAHQLIDSALHDVSLASVEIGHHLVVLPHEACPVDGIVRSGNGTMDESYLTGEPYLIKKTAGSLVLSGAINGETALTIEASRRAEDSRYARIVEIVRQAESRRPRMRRLADRLGSWYTPLAVAVAAGGWAASGEPSRFLAVLVIATPCPLLLGIPVAIIGAISTAARRGILIKDASILEQLRLCRTAIFDKTGTLTLGRPTLTQVELLSPALSRREVLSMAGSLEQYSRHPLATAVVAAVDSEEVPRLTVSEIREPPGEGLSGRVNGHHVRLIGRRQVSGQDAATLPPESAGLECVVVVDGSIAAILRFRDAPRPQSAAVIGHLRPMHGFTRLLLVSGDREAEVRDLAAQMHITDVRFGQTPEQKLEIVVHERRAQPVLFVGDGVNDAPAMVAATAAIAIGTQSDVTAASAGAVIMDGSISRVDELLHIAIRTRRIALQSAVGGMIVSVAGMALAAAGWLPPLAGAIAQEVIDVFAVLNALRASTLPRRLTDFTAE